MSGPARREQQVGARRVAPGIRSRALALLLSLAFGVGALPGWALADEPAATDEKRPSVADDDSVRYLVDTGPLRIRDQFALSMGYLALDPVGATVLDRGEWQFDVIATLTNSFATTDALRATLDARVERAPITSEDLDRVDASDPGSGIFLVDGEIIRSALALRRGFGRGVQVELVVPVLTLGGGSLDGTIEGFHDSFGFDPAGREGAPRESFQVDVRSRSGSLSIDSDPGTVLGDLVVGAKFRLLEPTDGRPMHLALETSVKLPTGNRPLASTGSADLGVQLVSTRYFRTSCLHAALGAVWLGEWRELGLGEQALLSGMVAYEQGLGRKSTALLQITVSQTPFRDLGLDELSRPSIQATIGFKRVFAKSNVFFLGITENIQNLNNSADIGVHVGFTRTLGAGHSRTSG